MWLLLLGGCLSCTVLLRRSFDFEVFSSCSCWIKVSVELLRKARLLLCLSFLCIVCRFQLVINWQFSRTCWTTNHGGQCGCKCVKQPAYKCSLLPWCLKTVVLTFWLYRQTRCSEELVLSNCLLFYLFEIDAKGVHIKIRQEDELFEAEIDVLLQNSSKN